MSGTLLKDAKPGNVDRVDTFHGDPSLFDQLYRYTPRGTLPFEMNEQLRRIFDHGTAGLVPGDMVLSLGAGRAVGEEQLAMAGVRVVAVDHSQEAIEQANRRIAEAHIENLRAVRADMRTYRINGEYDSIISICAMHWLEPAERQKVMAEHTKVGGFNLIVVALDVAVPFGSDLVGEAKATYPAANWSVIYSERDAGIAAPGDKFGILSALRTE